MPTIALAPQLPAPALTRCTNRASWAMEAMQLCIDASSRRSARSTALMPGASLSPSSSCPPSSMAAAGWQERAAAAAVGGGRRRRAWAAAEGGGGGNGRWWRRR